MTTLLKFAFLMCALVFATAQDEILFEEPTVLPGRVSDINPEQDFIMNEEAEGFKPASRQKILESIVTLKAYCDLAYDEAKSFQEMHSAGNTGLVNFVVTFGAKPKKNTKTNVVTAFATAIGESKGRFPIGMGHYLLMHLGKAVFEGKSTLKLTKIKGKNAMVFDNKAMGLETRASYFKRLDVPQMEYLTLVAKVKKASKDADAQAAAAWLASGSKAEYKSFKQKAQDNVHKKEAAYKNDKYMNALKAIKSAWAQSHSLTPMPVAGNKASSTVPALKLPTPEEVDAAAKKAAGAWEKNNDKGAALKAQKQAEKEATAKEKAKEQEEMIKAFTAKVQGQARNYESGSTPMAYSSGYQSS